MGVVGDQTLTEATMETYSMTDTFEHAHNLISYRDVLYNSVILELAHELQHETMLLASPEEENDGYKIKEVQRKLEKLVACVETSLHQQRRWCQDTKQELLEIKVNRHLLVQLTDLRAAIINEYGWYYQPI